MNKVLQLVESDEITIGVDPDNGFFIGGHPAAIAKVESAFDNGVYAKLKFIGYCENP